MHIFKPWKKDVQSCIKTGMKLYKELRLQHAYQSLACETAIIIDFSELFSLKCICVKYKNAVLLLIDCFFRT